MDKDGCGFSIIRLFWSVYEITIRWNGVQWWIVDILVYIGIRN